MGVDKLLSDPLSDVRIIEVCKLFIQLGDPLIKPGAIAVIPDREY
jgi:hypothetical protein